jgi:alpha-1,3-mannosyltransferase
MTILPSMTSTTSQKNEKRRAERWKKMFVYTMLFEVVLNVLLIIFEPTYVFDWDAYMEEVYGVFHNGTFDYSKLKGDTGALVYPAGFVWLYSVFYKLFGWDYVHFTTEYPESRKNISGYEERTIRPTTRMHCMQTMYMFLYLAVLVLLFRIFKRTRAVPPEMFPLLSLSRRVHSIFVLGLFNDCFALFFLLVAIERFTKDDWLVGCIWYSIAVSIKMNILLFAPGLLLLLLKRFGMRETIFPHLTTCALVQLLVAAPFLLTYPVQYIRGAFDFGRVFFHEWSVNFQFLPESVFHSKLFSLGLLFSQVAVLLMFVNLKWCNPEGTVLMSFNFYSGTSARSGTSPKRGRDLPVEQIVSILCTSNFIGIVFCRSLHYQFLVWYHFSLPYLLYQTPYPFLVKAVLLGAIEIAWNQHHPMKWSSIVLLVSHLILLFGLWRGHRDVFFTKRKRKA